MSTATPALVRAAEPRDVAAIHGLIGELADYEKLRHQFIGSAVDLERHLFGPRPCAWALVAEVDGVVRGFALSFRSYSTFLCRPGIYLEDLYVQPAWRRHGIGRALLAALAQQAVEEGCGRLEWAVLDWNAPSIAFYRQLGAQPMDEWTTFRLTGEALTRLAAG
ncbi:MAG: GNAT family N-acetyltransferase [Proteobacteria bacterium]|jgi:GNAT superfamily N-acetyltransferase|nr:GNAT family N-acetyltransferase [Pseudomonadota bacterium]